MNLYHITHINNLRSIISAGGLLSDRKLSEVTPDVVIGFDHIKRRRLEVIQLDCHPGTKVGDYVPFFFCPRPVMLYVIDRRPDQLGYSGGQRPIVHLVTTVEAVTNAAGEKPWAYSDGNAGAFYTSFYNDLDQINEILDWQAIRTNDWRDPAIRDRKQAEFLVYDSVPWECFHEIGVFDRQIQNQVMTLLEGVAHKPTVNVRRGWYY